MVYNLNRGIGWASSGVEYAQAYRAGILRKLGMEFRFVFTDMIFTENIECLTKNIGFSDDEIIWLYTFFTDFSIAPCTYTLDQLEETFANGVPEKEVSGSYICYRFPGENLYVTAHLTKDSQTCIQHTEYISHGNLLRKDYYFDRKVFSEYYAPKDGRGKLYMRRFFNRDGSEAYTEMTNGKESVFRIGNDIIGSKEQLISRMIQAFDFKKGDVVIMDRATEIAQSVFRHKGGAKLAVVVHAEHFNAAMTDNDNILWNNYYEYEFTNADDVDVFITSTNLQTDILRRQFLKYYGKSPRVVTIPVGSLDSLTYPREERKPFSMITASRLASEKHLDWLVCAACAARKKIPELTLDIYGKGSGEEGLTELIAKKKASDYIRLCGHVDLSDVYPHYAVYASASTSEGFGLSLMEAVGAGCAMIGFDVNYGNVTFIEHRVNGYLIPYKENAAKEAVKGLANAMVRMFRKADITRFSEASYETASRFLTDKVRDAWKTLLEELVDE